MTDREKTIAALNKNDSGVGTIIETGSFYPVGNVLELEPLLIDKFGRVWKVSNISPGRLECVDVFKWAGRYPKP